MNTNEITIPLGKLVPSKANVRRVNAEAGRAELAASIESHGLLHNLVTRKAPKGGKFEVVAGGRRLGALRLLLAEGRSVQGVAVTKEYPVRAILREDGSATELSLAENDQREPMHPVDEVIAYRDLVEEGMAAEDIAARFGQSVVTVRQRLKLASLSPCILDVLREGGMSLEQAKALAISDDHAAQEAAWFEQDGWSRNPANLRSYLTSAHVRATDRLARFVGLEAYEQAGGAVLRDLFAEDGMTFLTDRPLLVKLASEQLEAVADQLRPQGWKWVEISLESGLIHNGGFGRIHATRREPTEAEQAELSTLDQQRDELNAVIEVYAEGDPQVEADEARLRELESQIGALEAGLESLDPKEKMLAGCIITIAHAGDLQVVSGLVKPDDRKAMQQLNAGEGGEGEDGEPDTDNIQSAPPSGLSAALVEELTAIRTAAMRVELAGRPHVALAALLHPLVIAMFHDFRGRVESAVEVRGERRSLAVSVKGPDTCRALTGWNEMLEGWGNHIPGNAADLWAWLLEQDTGRLLDLLAVASAANLNAVSGRYDGSKGRLAQAEQVAAAVGLDMQRWWTPDAAFLGRLSKAAIADGMREAGCSEVAARAVERAPKDEGVLQAEKELDGRGWLPAPLRSPTREADDHTVIAIAAE
ncbi:ParB/RepB/Spo0J family partition protein [Mesorhizobium sp. GbtcB19]|uniref:ParB/RepB/Spo0J family partition protein n=1 Tax=Mesorhizobium sp. GbtcB19 TaxID=2824764 RepID=UPI001C2F3717|nr:ParB/RepB/Spo0J family partition protein [Mesorhizobium sp. GbtcB19]